MRTATTPGCRPLAAQFDVSILTTGLSQSSRPGCGLPRGTWGLLSGGWDCGLYQDFNPLSQ
jgi:hypothetical protein